MVPSQSMFAEQRIFPGENGVSLLSSQGETLLLRQFQLNCWLKRENVCKHPALQSPSVRNRVLLKTHP